MWKISKSQKFGKVMFSALLSPSSSFRQNFLWCVISNWDTCSEWCTIVWRTLWQSLAFFHELLRLETISGKYIPDYLHSQERPHVTPDHFDARCFSWTPFNVGARGRCASTPANSERGTAGSIARRPRVTAVPSAFRGAAGWASSYHLKGLGCVTRSAPWWHMSLLWLYCTEPRKRMLSQFVTTCILWPRLNICTLP